MSVTSPPIQDFFRTLVWVDWLGSSGGSDGKTAAQGTGSGEEQLRQTELGFDRGREDAG